MVEHASGAVAGDDKGCCYRGDSVNGHWTVPIAAAAGL